MKKFVALMLLAVMLATSMAAFAEPTENTMPIVTDGSVKLTVFMSMESGSEQAMATYDDHPAIQAWEEITGVDFTFIHPPAGDDGTYFNTLVASGQWPDIWIGTGFTDYYPGGVPQAVNDGILMNPNELVDAYASNYMNVRKSWDEATVRNFTTDDGLYRFGAATQVPPVVDKQHSGLVIRKDWLEKWGLEVPVTIEDFTNVLRAFKEHGVEVPFAGMRLDNWMWSGSNMLSAAFGVMNDSFQLNEDGKTVTYSVLEPGYKDWLNLLRGWMAEGLIDRDMVNRNDSDAQALFTSGRAGATFAGNWQTQQMNTLGQVSDPDFDLIGLTSLKPADDPAFINEFGDPIYNGSNTMWWTISTTCKYPEAAMRALDYLYSYDGIELMVFGPKEWKGEIIHTTDETGMRVFSDFILHNPNVPYNTIRYQYTIQNLSSEYCADMEMQQYSAPVNAQCWDAWTKDLNNRRRVPGSITLTSDESITQVNAMNNVRTFIREHINLIVCGDEDIANWDNDVQYVYSFGINDVIAVQQAAFDRYLAR
ncbi:MAG: extracellular solute-binding protein [Clostridia bacterium]|nr:extracellular solute-binding protein [Clostridia bacterium]